jgi:2-hydroxychromene-2-carboxylate isomerase
MIEFWFEFASTYSYPAALRVERMCRDADIELRWRPFLLGPIFSSQGWSDSPFNIYPAKGHYMWRDLERVCADLDIPFRRPSVFPRNGLLAARIACWFEGESWLPEFVRKVYLANFAFDHDISDVEVVGKILRELDQPLTLLTMAEAPEAKSKLRSQTERATTFGLFGAPSFTIGRELFWGNDRLETAVAWAKKGTEGAV